MDALKIAQVDAEARKRFSYISDGSIDTWRSHADEVLADKRWHGDCDDLASTVLDMLARLGVPLEDRFRLMVSATGTKIVDHMVGCVRAEDGSFLIVGDTFRPSYNCTQIKHRGIVYNRLNENPPHVEETIWREGFPWARASS